MDYNYFLPAGTPVSFKKGTYGFSLENVGYTFTIGVVDTTLGPGKPKPGYYLMDGKKTNKKGKANSKTFYSSYRSLRLGEQKVLDV